MRTRIKICGITRAEDIATAVNLGVDALGFVFVPSSSRFIDLQLAKQLLGAVPPFVTTVGLFMDQSQAEVAEIIEHCSINLLQFHGAETAEFCQQFDQAYIKAIPMGGNSDGLEMIGQHQQAQAFLFDSNDIGGMGGSGHVFDWSKLPQGMDRPLILAGGINSMNVAEAIRQLKPYAVDVSSGVEKAKGIKDPQKMSEFVQAVKTGDRIYETP